MTVESDDVSVSATEVGLLPRRRWWQRWFGGREKDTTTPLTDLRTVFSAASDSAAIDKETEQMLDGVLHITETRARDIMIPRSQIVLLEEDAPLEDLMNVMIHSGHSRFPVLSDDHEEVVGILLAKDVLRKVIEQASSGQSAQPITIRDCLRPVVFIPESKRLNVLLHDFRLSQNHMAIVVDEYGSIAGLVTIEDVIEQIVGDIDDEHDVDNQALIHQEADGSYSVRAITRIEDFNEAFDVELGDEEYDTVGGLVIHQLGRLPRKNEVVRLAGFQFKVMRATRRKVDMVRVSPDATDS